MSHHVAVNHLPPEGEKLQITKFLTWRIVLLLVGIAGAAASGFIFLEGGEQANSYAFSYLFALEVFFTITTGAVFWVLLHNASNSSWGVAIRRIPEVMTQLYLPLFVLALPIFAPYPLGSLKKPEWTQRMYEWIGIHAQIASNPPSGAENLRDGLALSHGTSLLYKKYPYLHNGFDLHGGLLPGWDLRVIIFFGLLFFIGRRMLNLSLEQDRTGAVGPTFRARFHACWMLPVFAVCSTFASIDWIMSLNYTWFSTMFGVNVFAGGALASMAVIILVVGTLVKTGHFRHIVSAEHFHLMGKLMHSFVIFWAYIAFSQFFLIWYANIPEETQFYAIRNTGGWWHFSLALVFAHFAIPFVFLLKRDAKRNLNAVMAASLFVVVVHMMELYWMIIPERGRSLYNFSSAPDNATFMRDVLFDGLAFLTFLGIYGFFLIRGLAKHSIYPCGDPRLEESVNVVS
ncbi:MAG: hypothetical protein JWM59_2161 [Verrucomicrobiales bacterium]|nr:hypothetical protein [Verrucomicrobiales bacterium]